MYRLHNTFNTHTYAHTQIHTLFAKQLTGSGYPTSVVSYVAALLANRLTSVGRGNVLQPSGFRAAPGSQDCSGLPLPEPRFRSGGGEPADRYSTIYLIWQQKANSKRLLLKAKFENLNTPCGQNIKLHKVLYRIHCITQRNELAAFGWYETFCIWYHAMILRGQFCHIDLILPPVIYCQRQTDTKATVGSQIKLCNFSLLSEVNWANVWPHLPDISPQIMNFPGTHRIGSLHGTTMRSKKRKSPSLLPRSVLTTASAKSTQW